MNYTNTTIKEFINKIITFNNIDDILKTCNSEFAIQEKGFIFERLFDIFIKFGFCELFNNTDYYHIIGNSNNGKPKILTNFDKYLSKKVISSNSSGCSDITLQNKKDKTYIFISSKYQNKISVDNFDIQNIVINFQ